MPSQRQLQYSREIARLAGRFLAERANHVSMITITRSDISADLKNANLYYTVMPIEKAESSKHFLNRLRVDLRTYIKKNMRSRTIPFVTFKLDEGELNRQRIDELLRDNP